MPKWLFEYVRIGDYALMPDRDFRQMAATTDAKLPDPLTAFALPADVIAFGMKVQVNSNFPPDGIALVSDTQMATPSGIIDCNREDE